MNENDEVMNQIASLHRLDEVVLRHIVLDMAVSAFSSPDGLAHQTLNLAKMAYRGMGSPAAPQHTPISNGKPPKKIAAALNEALAEGVGAATQHTGEILTREQAAEHKGVSLATLDRWAKEGRITRVPLPLGTEGGRSWRGRPRMGYPAVALDALPPVDPRGTRHERKQKRVPRHLAQEGDLTAAQWRTEVLEYARQHNGVLDMNHYKKIYSVKFPQNIALGKSRMRMVVYDSASRLKLFKNVRKGVYQLTAAGKSYEEESHQLAVAERAAAPRPKQKWPQQPQPKVARQSKGKFREWVVAYAKRHRGVVIVKDVKSSFREQNGGKQLTGGALYDYLNDPKLFNKEGEGRFVLTGVAGSAATKKAAPVRRAQAPVRREPVSGLTEDILTYAQQQPGGEIVMRDYNRHYDEVFGGAGAAASRTGTIYGAINTLIKQGRLAKVGTGVYRVRREAVAPAPEPEPEPTPEPDEVAVGASAG